MFSLVGVVLGGAHYRRNAPVCGAYELNLALNRRRG
jgi:hypothetical protein